MYWIAMHKPVLVEAERIVGITGKRIESFEPSIARCVPAGSEVVEAGGGVERFAVVENRREG